MATRTAKTSATPRQRAQQPKPMRQGSAARAGALEPINRKAAGIDVGSEKHFVAVPADHERPVREFGAFTADLYAIADWLHSCGIETVALESTGVYWIALMDVLEECGFEVKLVDPHQLKHVPGRKTDVVDSQWIQQLHSFGLLSGAFRPDEPIRVLRSLIRQRDMLIRYRGDHVRHIQKALTEMNLKLDRVLSDVTGATGMLIIRAILAGERDPVQLARHRNPSCKSSEETIAKSLEGLWRVEHLFSLRQAVELYDIYQEKIAACEQAIAAHVETFEDRRDPEPSPAVAPSLPARRGGRDPFNFNAREALHRMAGVDLTRIEGIAPQAAFLILSEIGLDMTRWASASRFSSWLGLCPGSKISGGKKLSSRTRPSANRAARAFRLAAYGLQGSKGPLGEFYRRMKARLGAPKAITATAHKLARIVYSMLSSKTEYNPSALRDEDAYQARETHRVKRMARKLGYELIPVDTLDQAVAA